MNRFPEPETRNLEPRFLAHATDLAESGLGRTWPNPTVGCVIVKDGTIIAAARTADGGRPHAEALALTQAGENARGATVYVTLEPCAHHGETPPCAQGLIEGGVARVIIGCTDPDPRVNGKGIAMLQAAGIEVLEVSNHESRITNRGFFRRVQHGLPHVAMKLATSADFFMARSDGGGQWITGETARAHGNSLRAQYDALLTGIGTALADDPLLTARMGDAPHPALVRIVADRGLRLPLASRLVATTQQFPLWVITTPEGIEQRASHAGDLRERGVKLLALEDTTPEAILRALAAEGITRLLIEAGPSLSAAFLGSGQVEMLHHYAAPFALGNAGAAPINGLNDLTAHATRTQTRTLGDDLYTCYELAPCSPD